MSTLTLLLGEFVKHVASTQGHLGTDGRYYLLDFGRTFPAESPLHEVVTWLSCVGGTQ